MGVGISTLSPVLASATPLLTHVCRESVFRLWKSRLQISHRCSLALAKGVGSEAGNSGRLLTSRVRSRLAARAPLCTSRFLRQLAQFSFASPRFNAKKVSSLSRLSSSKIKTKMDVLYVLWAEMVIGAPRKKFPHSSEPRWHETRCASERLSGVASEGRVSEYGCRLFAREMVQL